MVAAGPADPVQLAERDGQSVEGGVVVEGALDEPEPLGQVPPHLFGERRARVLADRVVDDLLEVLVAQSRRAKPTRAKPGGSKPRLARS